MGSIKLNMPAILNKAEAFMQSSAGQQKISAVIDRAVYAYEVKNSPQEAARVLIEVLKDCVNTGVSRSAAQSLLNQGFFVDGPSKVAAGIYAVSVGFDGDLFRPSLTGYDGIDDISALLNDGVDHVMRPVYGYWPSRGIMTWSSNVIFGANYIERAIDIFSNSFGREFNVISIYRKE